MPKAVRLEGREFGFRINKQTNKRNCMFLYLIENEHDFYTKMLKHSA